MIEAIHFMIKKLYRLSSIPTRYLNTKENHLYLSLGYDHLEDPVQNPQLKSQLLNMASTQSEPILYFDEEKFIYGLVRDISDGLVIIGPITIRPLSHNDLQQYIYLRQIKSEIFQVQKSTLLELSAYMSVIFFLLTGRKVNEKNIISNMGPDEREKLVTAYDYQQYKLGTADEEIIRLDYSDERRFLQNVKNGDIDGVLRYETPRGSESRVGHLADDPLKQVEYMLCSSITLVSRAAIEAGLSPSVAYPLSDLYFKKLEGCKNQQEMYSLSFEMVVNFASKVRQYKDDLAKKSHIEASKSFILNHINIPFSLDSLAKHLGINKSYLSRSFTAEVGVGIQKYTQIKRIEAACNMLKYSHADLSFIADYLCFSSQSHFGKVFKEIKKTTPKKYKDQEKLNYIYSKF